MMHVLCEEYETVYAACFLITSAVLGVDYGYDVNAQGQLEYVIQIEPETLKALKPGEPITFGRPSNVERIQAFRVRIGNDELSKVVPASYEKPVNDGAGGLTPMAENSAILTSPPNPATAADAKPALAGEELASDYGGGTFSTRQLPSAATSGTTPGSSATGSPSEIPNAQARYGNFSVPASTGITYPGGAAGATTTTSEANSLRPTSTGTAGASSTIPPPPTTIGNTQPGSSYLGGGYPGQTTGITGTPTNPSSTSGSSRWEPGAQSGVGGTNSATGSPSGASPNISAGGTSTTPRYGTPLTTPTPPAEYNSQTDWRNSEVSNNLGGSTSGFSQTGLPNSGSSGMSQSGGSMAPPLANTGNLYPNNNAPLQPSVPTNNLPNNQDPSWIGGAWGNNPPSTTQNNQLPPPPLQTPSGQYGTSQPNYNYPQQPNSNGSGYPNNGFGQYPPQGSYAANPNYGGPNGVLNYGNQQYIPVASLPSYLPNPAPYQPPPPQTNTTTTTKPTDEEEDDAKKESPPEKEVVKELPEWWQLLALGFLISICANAYMFMTTQDFRRKYQDLLEDVRDLRTLSND